MNEAKFTKGQWKVVDRRVDSLEVFGQEGIPKDAWPFEIIMPCPPFALGMSGALIPKGQDEEAANANAHLIAAAPDMYEALGGMFLLAEAMLSDTKELRLYGNDRERISAAKTALAKARGES